MKEELNNICQIILKDLTFVDYKDFCQDAKIIKSIFLTCDFGTRCVYRWYIYSQKMRTNHKDRIWEYLNDDITFEDLLK